MSEAEAAEPQKQRVDGTGNDQTECSSSRCPDLPSAGSPWPGDAFRSVWSYNSLPEEAKELWNAVDQPDSRHHERPWNLPSIGEPDRWWPVLLHRHRMRSTYLTGHW